MCAPFLVSVEKHEYGYSPDLLNSRYGLQARVTLATTLRATKNTEK